MAKNITSEQKDFYDDVAAIITAMTDDEKPFLLETLESVLMDPDIAQIILCIENKNNWFDSIAGSLIYDSRLEIIHLPMMPIGAIRNTALTYVKKSWITYCDGDDVWCKGKTGIQRKYADQMNADFVGTGHYLTNEAGTLRAFGLSMYIAMPSSWLVRTDIMRKYPFNEEWSRGSDGEWWIRTDAFIKKVKCPEMLLRYRVRPISTSTMAPSKKRKLKFIKIAGIPVLGWSIFIITYVIWVFTKHLPYKWKPIWSEWLNEHENIKK
jgi:hypothetical protein